MKKLTRFQHFVSRNIKLVLAQNFSPHFS